jgi:hypothetical protein
VTARVCGPEVWRSLREITDRLDRTCAQEVYYREKGGKLLMRLRTHPAEAVLRILTSFERGHIELRAGSAILVGRAALSPWIGLVLFGAVFLLAGSRQAFVLLVLMLSACLLGVVQFWWVRKRWLSVAQATLWPIERSGSKAGARSLDVTSTLLKIPPHDTT